MCSIKVPLTILKQVDKYMRHCLWREGDINAKKPPLVAWKMVTKPKANLRLQNGALLLKNLHKFFNQEDMPGVKLLWINYYSNGHVPGQSAKGSFWWRRNPKFF
jgi:hypothetical protein